MLQYGSYYTLNHYPKVKGEAEMFCQKEAGEQIYQLFCSRTDDHRQEDRKVLICLSSERVSTNDEAR